MDPNANLEELRRLVAKLVEDSDYIGREEDGARLAELISALDGWLSKGGFLPKAWERKAQGMGTEADADLNPDASADPVLGFSLSGPTRAAFLAAYRPKVETFGWAKKDPAMLETFMAEVARTLAGETTTSWIWDSPFALEAFRAIGGTGRLTLKALRALP